MGDPCERESRAAAWGGTISPSGWDTRPTSEVTVTAWEADDPVYGVRQRITIAVSNTAIHVSYPELKKLLELIDKAIAQVWPEKDVGGGAE